MKILVDTHTHNLLSGHAYSTLLENVKWASEIGLEGMVNSDHGPEIPGASPEFCLSVQRTLPEEIYGVRVYRGVEANIMDYEGSIDIPKGFLKMTDFVIASMHDVVISPGSREENLAAYEGVFKNPYVDLIGHPGTPAYDMDREAFVKAAQNENRLIEVNNHSFRFRKGSGENCNEIVRMCKKYGVRVAVSSDAHFCMGVGKFEYALKILEENNFPAELVVNRTLKSMDEYLKERSKRVSG
jgi:putative hydrolase